ncbi:MAG: ABC transporter permease [Steroidobacteraceae bacterium]
MFRHYLQAALRNMARSKLHVSTNIVGLAVGFATALLIALYVRNELSYEHFLSGHERIYRIYSMGKVPFYETAAETATAASGISDWMQLEFPGVESIARLATRTHDVRRDEVMAQEDITWTEPAFFKIFQLPVIAGNLDNALTNPNDVVLTRTMARKYFGRDDPIGETLQLNLDDLVRVVAVIEDTPSTTHLKLGMIGCIKASFLGFDWNNAFATYLRLKPGAAAAAITQSLPQVVARRLNVEVVGSGFRVKINTSLHLLPIDAIHLHQVTTDGTFKTAPDMRALSALAIIAVLIVMMVVTNFVNLMTARGAQRNIEVGIRKVAGANRGCLIAQFIGEAMIYTWLGLACAVALVELLLPTFNAFLQSDIPLRLTSDPALLLSLLILGLIIGMMAGVYPALVLSSYRPTQVLRGIQVRQGGSDVIRQSLVVGQFSILIGLLLAATVLYRQTLFVMNEGLRLNKDQIVLLRTGIVKDLKAAIEDLPGVSIASYSNSVPLNAVGTSAAVIPGIGAQPVDMAMVDFGFFELYGLHPVAGRFFDKAHTVDLVQANNGAAGSTVVINETLRRKLGFKTAQAALGKTLQAVRPIRDKPPSLTSAEIIGVAPDFAMGSIQQAIPATFYYVDPPTFNLMSIKLQAQTIPETLQAIEKLWRRFGESRPISWFFFDQHLQALYADNIRMGILLALSAGIAIVVACLGLFGLVTFNLERRTKEIGVRKTMGANTPAIMYLLLWQFAKPVLLANLIAYPVAGLIMNRWLHGFAYHIDLEPWLFAATGATAIMIALLTVGMHCYLVARAKPVVALRYE